MEITAISPDVLNTLQNMLLPLFKGFLLMSAFQIGVLCALLGVLVYKR